jgi:hypothetical protein
MQCIRHVRVGVIPVASQNKDLLISYLPTCVMEAFLLPPYDDDLWAILVVDYSMCCYDD